MCDFPAAVVDGWIWLFTIICPVLPGLPLLHVALLFGVPHQPPPLPGVDAVHHPANQEVPALLALHDGLKDEKMLHYNAVSDWPDKVFRKISKDLNLSFKFKIEILSWSCTEEKVR